MSFEIIVSTASARRALDAILTAFPTAVSRALNRTASGVRTTAVRGVAAETGLRARDIRRRMQLRRASIGNPQAAVFVVGRPIPLLRFPRAKRSGLPVTDFRGTPVTLTGSFRATMRSGRTGIFKRLRPTRSRIGKPRGSPALPIDQLFGPSIPKTVSQGHLLRAVLARGEVDLEKNLRQQVRFLVSQGRLQEGAEEALF